jgi:hypothetical protein
MLSIPFLIRSIITNSISSLPLSRHSCPSSLLVTYILYSPSTPSSHHRASFLQTLQPNRPPTATIPPSLQGEIFYQIAAARSRREAKQGHPIWGFGQEGLLSPRPTSPDTAAANSGCPFAGLVKKKEGHEEDGKEENGNGNGNGYQDEKTSLLGKEEAEERKKEKAYTRQQID